MTKITSIQQLIAKGYIFQPLSLNKEKNKSVALLIKGSKNKHKSIILKVFFQNTPQGMLYDNSLTLESLIYRNILKPLVLRQHTPNLLKYYGCFSESFNNFQYNLNKCSSSLNNLLQLAYKKEAADKKRHNIRVRNTKKLKILGLEHCPAPSLRQWLQTNRSNAELKSVLFQIIYTAECIYRAGIRHNDLHVGNIFIDTTYQKTISYILDSNTVVNVPTNTCFVKIFDFDNACSITNKSFYNYKLKRYRYWEQYGMSNTDNPKYDSFTILSSILGTIQKHSTNKYLADLIKQDLINNHDLLNNKWKHTHRLGKKADGTYFHKSQNSTYPDYKPSDTELINNSDILTHKIFDNWTNNSISLITNNSFHLPEPCSFK